MGSKRIKMLRTERQFKSRVDAVPATYVKDECYMIDEVTARIWIRDGVAEEVSKLQFFMYGRMCFCMCLLGMVDGRWEPFINRVLGSSV